jgi:transmembrane 9 superfamily member 3
LDNNNRFNEYALQSIGEHLSGHLLRHSGHDVRFAAVDSTETCTTAPLTAVQTEQFITAIQHRWFYQMFLDDLPVWGMVGELLNNNENGNTANGIAAKEKDDLDRLEHVVDVPLLTSNMIPHVYTTRNLKVMYNNDQIVQVDLHSDPASLVPVTLGATLQFTLNVHWEATAEHEFHSRFDRYLDHDFFKHPIHWFSVFNSFMMVLFLMGLVALILLRTLRKDYARYGMVPDMEEGDDDDVHEDSKLMKDATHPQQHHEDSGWKQVHGDVFRAPLFLPLFAAMIGTGAQILVLSISVIVFAILGPLHGGQVHEARGEVWHAVIVCYALSSVVAGYASGRYFKQYYPTTSAARRTEKTALWQAVMGLTVLLMPTITTTTLFVLNAVSLYYGTINTIPFLVICKLFLIWVFVSVPLCVVGTLLGRHSKIAPFPCRVNAIPRPIPDDVPWYGKPSGLIPLAGLLSFGSIFIELYYVLTSLWNYKYYHVYGFLFGVLLILILVVSMTSIIVVYFMLNAENFHWQWTAFGSGAATGLYVLLYGAYYFIAKTAMHGFLQTVFYFGYTMLLSVNLSLVCGVIGYGAASVFVATIFQNVKVD